jgi:hypothetical protein
LRVSPAFVVSLSELSLGEKTLTKKKWGMVRHAATLHPQHLD